MRAVAIVTILFVCEVLTVLALPRSPLLLHVARFSSPRAFHSYAVGAKNPLPRLFMRPQVDLASARHASPSLQSSTEQQLERTTKANSEDVNQKLDANDENTLEDEVVTFEDVILNLDAKGEDNVEDDAFTFEDPLIQRQKDEMEIEAAEAAAKENMESEANNASVSENSTEAAAESTDGEVVGVWEDLSVANESSGENGGATLERTHEIGEETSRNKDAIALDTERKVPDAQSSKTQDMEEQPRNSTKEQKVDPIKESKVQDEDRDNKGMQRRWFGFETSGTFSPAYEGTLRYETADWIKNFGKGTLTLRRILSPLLFNSLVTLATCMINQFFGPVRALPALPHQLSGSVLSLLLVFRNNNAYTRFWEARTHWGKVTNECRELAALSTSFMSPRQSLPMLALISLYPHVMMNYLQGERDMKMVKRLVNEQEAEALKQVLNQPQYVLNRMRMLAFDSVKAGVDVRFRDYVIPRLYNLGETVSNCERIFNTPIPLAYSGHLSRFLTIYLSTLPLVLISSLGWKTLPVMFILCWALLGIKEIGDTIEEPFRAIDGETGRALLPMKEICRTIRRDVRATAAAQQIALKFNAPSITSSNPNFLDNLPDSLKDLLQMFDQDSSSQAPMDGGEVL